jgi:hypothetical protein
MREPKLPYIPARGLRLRYLRHAVRDNKVDPKRPYLMYSPTAKDIELVRNLRKEYVRINGRYHRSGIG